MEMQQTAMKLHVVARDAGLQQGVRLSPRASNVQERQSLSKVFAADLARWIVSRVVGEGMDAREALAESNAQLLEKGSVHVVFVGSVLSIQKYACALEWQKCSVDECGLLTLNFQSAAR